MKFAIRPRFQLALALLTILAAYFQSISHPFSLFDDVAIIEHYGINSSLSFLDIITPNGSIYYRPLINLSYWLDFQLWGMDSTFMHLENIVVHLINVFLVFLIASRLPVSFENNSLPILSALLFGLHPINSESVNWIAGRTDVFAGLFVFIAVYCLIRAIQEQSARLAIIAFAVAFVGTLAKETAIMFIPAAFIVTTYWPDVHQNISGSRTWRKRCLHVPIVILSCIVLSVLILVFVKGPGNNALTLIFEGDTNIILRSLEAFGFYVKKIFLPLPLNIAIVEVNPLYAVFGVLALCVSVMTFRSAKVPGIFIVLSVLFMLPAFIVANTSFAWTPFGERYLYIPSAFAVIGCLDLFRRILIRWSAIRWFVPVVGIVIVVASTLTVQRGTLWGDNLALIEDTIVKSPRFGVMRNQYGGLLTLAGRQDEAEKQYIIASQQKNKANVDRVIRLNLLRIKLHGKQQDEARRILLAEIGNKANGDVELLKLINQYDETLLGEVKSLVDKKKIVAEVIETNEILYIKTREPFYLYKSGQLALTIGDKQKAGILFRKAYESARPDAYYRESARRLAGELVAK